MENGPKAENWKFGRKIDPIFSPLLGHFSPTILFKIITRIKLLFSNYLGRYSYSFRARQELISVAVTVLWVWREYVFTVTVRYSYIKNGPWNLFSENYSYSYIKNGFSNYKCNDLEIEKNGISDPGPLSNSSANFFPFSAFGRFPFYARRPPSQLNFWRA